MSSKTRNAGDAGGSSAPASDPMDISAHNEPEEPFHGDNDAGGLDASVDATASSRVALVTGPARPISSATNELKSFYRDIFLRTYKIYALESKKFVKNAVGSAITSSLDACDANAVLIACLAREIYDDRERAFENVYKKVADATIECSCTLVEELVNTVQGRELEAAVKGAK